MTEIAYLVYNEGDEPETALVEAADLVAERLDTGSYWIEKNRYGEAGVMVEADAFEAFVAEAEAALNAG